MTKTKTIQQTKAEQRRADLAEAEQRHAIATERLETARETAARAEALVRAGDLDVTPEQIRDARDAVGHWDIVAAAQAQQVTTARRRLLPDAPELAEAVAYTLGTSVCGVQAEALDTVPEYDGSPTPRVVVTQTGMHTGNGGGGLVGKVTITMVGADYVQPMDPNAVVAAMTCRDALTTTDTRTMSSTRSLSLDVTAYPELPTIAAAPTDYYVAGYAKGLAASIVNQSYSPTFQDQTVTGTGGGLVKSTKVIDGEHVSVVDVSLTVAPVRDSMGDAWYTGAEVVERTQARLKAAEGRIMSAVGRIEAVTLTSAEPRKSLRGMVYVVHADMVVRAKANQ